MNLPKKGEIKMDLRRDINIKKIKMALNIYECYSYLLTLQKK